MKFKKNGNNEKGVSRAIIDSGDTCSHPGLLDGERHRKDEERHRKQVYDTKHVPESSGLEVSVHLLLLNTHTLHGANRASYIFCPATALRLRAYMFYTCVRAIFLAPNVYLQMLVHLGQAIVNRI